MVDISIETPLAFLHTLFASVDRLHPVYLATTLLLATFLFLRYRASSGDRATTFLGYLFPKRIYAHPSAVVDYKIFTTLKIVIPLIVAAALGALPRIFSGSEISIAAVPDDRSLALIGAYTLASVMAYDFGRYLTHRAFHELPLLWEFHKVHHSAQVMTPITNFRFHPVEAIANAIVAMVVMGFVATVFNSLLGAGLTAIEVLGINAMAVVFHVTGSNLRHSHLWLSYGRMIEHVFISPAQHQIHHSAEEPHLDKNYGFQFALWDWALGSLYVPQGREQFRLGLANPAEETDHDTLLRAWGMPFKRVFEILLARHGSAVTVD